MATYLDETTPADSEAITLGASRIRELKQELDAVIDQIFATTGLFNAHWITAPGANVTGGVSMFAPGAIQTVDIAPLAITTALLDTNAVGPSQINPTAITTALLAAASAISQLTVPTASVNTAAIADAAVGTSQIAAKAVTAGLLAAGSARIAFGQYSGSNSAAAVVSTLTFAPSVIVITDTTLHGLAIAFLAEVSAGYAPLHDSWDAATTIGSPYLTAVQFGSGGFTIVPSSFQFNRAGHTYTYLALGTT